MGEIKISQNLINIIMLTIQIALQQILSETKDMTEEELLVYIEKQELRKKEILEKLL
jgi:hypothetical protein